MEDPLPRGTKREHRDNELYELLAGEMSHSWGEGGDDSFEVTPWESPSRKLGHNPAGSPAFDEDFVYNNSSRLFRASLNQDGFFAPTPRRSSEDDYVDLAEFQDEDSEEGEQFLVEDTDDYDSGDTRLRSGTSKAGEHVYVSSGTGKISYGSGDPTSMLDNISLIQYTLNPKLNANVCLRVRQHATFQSQPIGRINKASILHGSPRVTRGDWLRVKVRNWHTEGWVLTRLGEQTLVVPVDDVPVKRDIRQSFKREENRMERIRRRQAELQEEHRRAQEEKDRMLAASLQGASAFSVSNGGGRQKKDFMNFEGGKRRRGLFSPKTGSGFDPRHLASEAEDPYMMFDDDKSIGGQTLYEEIPYETDQEYTPRKLKFSRLRRSFNRSDKSRPLRIRNNYRETEVEGDRAYMHDFIRPNDARKLLMEHDTHGGETGLFFVSRVPANNRLSTPTFVMYVVNNNGIVKQHSIQFGTRSSTFNEQHVESDIVATIDNKIKVAAKNVDDVVGHIVASPELTQHLTGQTTPYLLFALDNKNVVMKLARWMDIK
eukprot:m.177862 g.177862  ORF g.177862 m.177862 type:complete len:544 (+) comp15460_c1_seq1:147-1778(+)